MEDENYLKQRIIELEKENCFLKGKLLAHEEIQTEIHNKIVKMETMADTMYSFLPLLTYVENFALSFFRYLPLIFQKNIPAPNFSHRTISN